MTTIRDQQLGTVTVAGGSAAQPTIQQLATVIVGSNPPAAAIRIQQLATVVVAANNIYCTPIGPVLRLSCWTPCGWMLTERSIFQ